MVVVEYPFIFCIFNFIQTQRGVASMFVLSYVVTHGETVMSGYQPCRRSIDILQSIAIDMVLA